MDPNLSPGTENQQPPLAGPPPKSQSPVEFLGDKAMLMATPQRFSLCCKQRQQRQADTVLRRSERSIGEGPLAFPGYEGEENVSTEAICSSHFQSSVSVGVVKYCVTD